jgi:SAM-dependent methyltransferase
MSISFEDPWSVTLIAGSDADDESFTLHRSGESETIRLHDYARLFSIPGLYERVVQEMLGCRSPAMATSSLLSALATLGRSPDECRVLDLGAGNGIVGEFLRSEGVSDVVGVDVLPEAREACLRDRPGVYSSYLVTDLGKASSDLADTLRNGNFTALTCVGALGGGHISADALDQVIEALAPGSLVVLTLHDKWLHSSQREGIGAMLQALFSCGVLRLMESEHFVHRVDTSGAELVYVCLVATRQDVVKRSA